jgi:hypothetical protein
MVKRDGNGFIQCLCAIVIFICEGSVRVEATFREFILCLCGLQYLFLRLVHVVTTDYRGFRICLCEIVIFI